MINPIGSVSLPTAVVRTNAADAAAATPAPGAPSFESLIGDAVGTLAGRLRTAEATAIAGIKGQASTQEVVEKVMAAEQHLQGAIAIRDKVVLAYQEISRMAI